MRIVEKAKRVPGRLTDILRRLWCKIRRKPYRPTIRDVVEEIIVRDLCEQIALEIDREIVREYELAARDR
jgi:hypothetical protein